MPYTAPTGETSFILDALAGYAGLSATDRFAEATPDVSRAVLEEAGRLAERLAPLGAAGESDPARLENGRVRTPDGFADGYGAIAGGGWVGLAARSHRGGMGLPQALNVALNEYLSAACLPLEIKLLLTQGQIEALEHHGSPEQQALYLPKLVSGAWSGTMNLTEPQAGSDLGALKAKAEPDGAGAWAITGQKIYISWGDSDLVENVCHLVLARTPSAPAGTPGVSMFMVPKVLPAEDGTPGARNALRVVSLEKKLGLHGAPTAVMSFEGAKGWLVGPEHGGMAAMFTMMNTARLGVGAQGIGLAEAAYQLALAHAKERRQGRAGGTGAIVEHPDVRRMLAEARAEIFAARAIALACGVASTGCRRAAARTGRRGRHFSPPSPRATARQWAAGSPTSASRCMAAWATSSRPGQPGSCATRGSHRSTRAPTASRRSTSWDGSSPTAARPRSASSTRSSAARRRLGS